MQAGPSGHDTHFFFAANIVKMMIFPDPHNTQLATMVVPKLLDAFDRVFTAYCELKHG